jgi:tetratricopeptide (TPR) repeat protein
MRNAGFLLMLLVLLAVPAAASGTGSFEDRIEAPALKKAWDCLKEGRPAEARRALEAYEKEPGSAAIYHYISARAEMDPLKAIEHLRSAYLQSPEDDLKELSLLERAEAYLRLGYLHEARSIYLIFLDYYPDSIHAGKAHLGAARSLKGLGLPSEALKHYRQAGSGPEALFGEANALQDLGMIEEAHKKYEEAISGYRDYLWGSDETLFHYGETLRLEGRPDEAREHLGAVKAPPWVYRAKLSLGHMAMASGDIEEAVKLYGEAALSRSRGLRRQGLLEQALAEIKAGRLQEAKVNLETIRRNYPYGKDYDRAVLALARLQSEDGKFDEAVSLLKELIFRLSPLKEALDEFEAIILKVMKEDVEQFVRLWKSVGPWLLDRSREKALTEIAEGLKGTGEPYIEISRWLAKNGTGTSKTRGLVALADFHAGMGNTEMAKEYLERLRSLIGTVDDIVRTEAKLLYARGQYRAAFEKLMSVKEPKKDDLEYLAHTLTSAGDVKKAIAFYESVLDKVGPDAQDYIRFADILYSLEMRAEALHYYRLSLDRGPRDEWALYRVAVLSDRTTAEGIFREMSKGGSALGRLAGARLKEYDVERTVKGTF